MKEPPQGEHAEWPREGGVSSIILNSCLSQMCKILIHLLQDVVSSTFPGCFVPLAYCISWSLLALSPMYISLVIMSSQSPLVNISSQSPPRSSSECELLLFASKSSSQSPLVIMSSQSCEVLVSLRTAVVSLKSDGYDLRMEKLALAVVSCWRFGQICSLMHLWVMLYLFYEHESCRALSFISVSTSLQRHIYVHLNIQGQL